MGRRAPASARPPSSAACTARAVAFARRWRVTESGRGTDDRAPARALLPAWSCRTADALALSGGRARDRTAADAGGASAQLSPLPGAARVARRHGFRPGLAAKKLQARTG